MLFKATRTVGVSQDALSKQPCCVVTGLVLNLILVLQILFYGNKSGKKAGRRPTDKKLQ